MSRPKNKSVPEDLRARPGIRTKIFVRDDMIGGGKIELLRQIGETGSISAAARAMGMGYRRAWFLLDTLQACFAEPLVLTARGGGAKSGARLTALGKDLLERFAAHETAQAQVSADFIDWLEKNQAAE